MHLTVGWILVGRLKFANASTSGQSFIYQVPSIFIYALTLSSVRIDIDQLLADREAERAQQGNVAKEVKAKSKTSRKRKAFEESESAPNTKKLKIRINKPVCNENVASAPAGSAPSTKPKVLLKLGPPQPKAQEETFLCCLCVSVQREGLLRVMDPPLGRKEGASGSGKDEPWMAHEECANVVPETWVDEIMVGVDPQTGASLKEIVVFGVDSIVKDRWNLVRFTFYPISGAYWLPYRNAARVPRSSTKPMAHPYSALKVDVLRLSMSHVPARVLRTTSSTVSLAYRKRKSSLSTPRLLYVHKTTMYQWFPSNNLLNNCP